jgi:hypothetical protein
MLMAAFKTRFRRVQLLSMHFNHGREVAIYALLVIFIFLLYSIGAPFASLLLE